jgi:hypothetical protein
MQLRPNIVPSIDLVISKKPATAPLKISEVMSMVNGILAAF